MWRHYDVRIDVGIYVVCITLSQFLLDFFSSPSVSRNVIFTRYFGQSAKLDAQFEKTVTYLMGHAAPVDGIQGYKA